MSAKAMILAAMLASGAGAGAAYLKNNPAAFGDLKNRIMSMHGMLGPNEEPEKPYARSAYYTLCRRSLSEKLNELPTSRRRPACECVDKEIAGWSEGSRKAVLFAFHQTALDYGEGRYSSAPRRSVGALSNHQRHIQKSRRRRQEADDLKAAQEIGALFEGSGSSINPLRLAWSMQDLENLTNKCGITGPPPESLQEVGERFNSLGTAPLR